jgi:ubiquinone biosynthesis protein
MGSIPERLREISRFRDIMRVAVKFGFSHYFSDRKGRKRELDPVRLRKSLEELGGTFVKLGQLLSLRPDLVPATYCKELSKLQDRVKPFSLEEAKRVLHEELGESGRMIELRELIAAASVGQVYRAEINKEEIAIKILRPGIERTMDSDIRLLHHLSEFLKRKFPSDVIDPVEIFEQFKMYSENELNFMKEAQSIDQIGKNFAKTHVKIPHVYWHFTSKRVLTMDYIRGTPLRNARLSKEEKKVVVRDLVNTMFKQIFIDGYFHADPHPGNIIILPDKNLALIDFGIVGVLNDKMRKNLSDVFIGLIGKDLDRITDAFIRLNLVESDVNREQFKSDLMKSLGKYYDKELSRMNMGEFIMNTFSVAKKNNIHLPKDYVLLGKCLLTLEGVCHSMMPEFNIVQESKPFVASMIKRDAKLSTILSAAKEESKEFFRFMTEVPEKTNVFLSDLHELDSRMLLMEKDLQKMNTVVTRGANRIVLGIIIGALVIAFALVVGINPTYAGILLILALLLVLDMLVMMVKER